MSRETKKSLASNQTKIRIIVRAFDHRIIDEATKTIVETAESSGAVVAGPVPMPRKIEKFTVNRATFKHKTAKDQFEMRTHKRLVDIQNPTQNTVSSLQNLTLASGVDIEIKMV
jgi:small subunit ribosomal protein S10